MPGDDNELSICGHFKRDTHEKTPPKKATGPPPISRIFLWQESKRDVLVCGGECECIPPPTPPLPDGPWPTKWVGDRNISNTLRLKLNLIFRNIVDKHYIEFMIRKGFIDYINVFNEIIHILLLVFNTNIEASDDAQTPKQWTHFSVFLFQTSSLFSSLRRLKYVLLFHNCIMSQRRKERSLTPIFRSLCPLFREFSFTPINSRLPPSSSHAQIVYFGFQ